MRNKLFFLFFLILLVVPLVASAPPVFNVISDVGLEITPVKHEYFKQGEVEFLHFHVYNVTDGILMKYPEVSCSFHLYNTNGKHLIENKSIAWNGNEIDFYINIESSTMLNLTLYPYIITCNTSTFGGAYSDSIGITYNGIKPAEDGTLVAFYITFLAFIFLMIFTLFRLAYYFKDFNVNVMDVCYSFCIYLGAITLYYFNDALGGVYLIHRVTLFFIKVGWITHILIPIVAYILTITIGDLVRASKNRKRDSEQNG